METTLIVSDIHLGAWNSEGAALLDLLDTRFDRLVINGDTVDHMDFRRFRTIDWNVITRLQRMCRGRELVLLRGNHDWSPAARHDAGRLDLLARLIGADVQEEFALEVGPRRYLVLHGDQFDDTLNLTRLGDWADSAYRVLQRCNRCVAGWAKHSVKRLSGVVGSVRRRAIDYARAHGHDGVIVGHTHFPCDETHGDIHYLNSGCWVDRPCSYISARGDDIALRHWEKRNPAAVPALSPRFLERIEHGAPLARAC